MPAMPPLLTASCAVAGVTASAAAGRDGEPLSDTLGAGDLLPSGEGMTYPSVLTSNESDTVQEGAPPPLAVPPHPLPLPACATAALRKPTASSARASPGRGGCAGAPLVLLLLLLLVLAATTAPGDAVAADGGTYARSAPSRPSPSSSATCSAASSRRCASTGLDTGARVVTRVGTSIPAPSPPGGSWADGLGTAVATRVGTTVGAGTSTDKTISQPTARATGAGDGEPVSVPATAGETVARGLVEAVLLLLLPTGLLLPVGLACSRRRASGAQPACSASSA